MDHAEDGDQNDVFVYMGGSVPQHLRGTIIHVRVHKSVKIITRDAFINCRNLVSIEMHDGVEIIEEAAFWGCAFRRIKLTGVRVIGENAFGGCTALEEVEFGDKLETIGEYALNYCTNLRTIKIPKVRSLGNFVFYNCHQLTEVDLSKDLERIGHAVFNNCPLLRRIAMPLKGNLLGDNVFIHCDDLSQVGLVGGIHKTIDSLLLESWRNEIKDEIDSINQVLPNTPHINKTVVTQQWMERVIRRIEHFKWLHWMLLKEFTTLLELALWKVKLDDESQNDERSLEGRDQPAKKAKIDVKAARQEQRITSGANIVIKNVLPFLKLE